jgi:DNA-binding transcriptional ArsR family regulator
MLVRTFTSNYLYIMKTRRDVYQAIADPTRRAIIQLIAAEPLDIKSLTAKFDMSQQAVSLHVKVLADCGLVRMEQRGRNRYCQPRLDKLEEVAEWVAQYRRHWESKLDNLELYLQKLKKGRYGKQKK